MGALSHTNAHTHTPNNNVRPLTLAHTRLPTFSHADRPDNFGRHFSIAFMTNGGNFGGYLKLFLASREDAVVQIQADVANINQVLVIPGKSPTSTKFS